MPNEQTIRISEEDYLGWKDPVSGDLDIPTSLVTGQISELPASMIARGVEIFAAVSPGHVEFFTLVPRFGPDEVAGLRVYRGNLNGGDSVELNWNGSEWQ